MIQLQALVDWNFPEDIDYDETKQIQRWCKYKVNSKLGSYYSTFGLYACMHVYTHHNHARG